MSSLARLARQCNLQLVTQDALTWRRRKAGKGFSYRDEAGRPIADGAARQRLASLAVPPAYQDVRYASDPRAHLQAVGIDAAGRMQYRYHSDWEHVRELRKARRLAKMAQALPKLRRALSKHLAAPEPTKAFALAAVVELVALTAIRAGSDSYARERGTRGATTLLKSNVTFEGDTRAVFRFKGKGGNAVTKEICVPRYVGVLQRLKALPGPRLFQYRGADGALHPVRASEVNAFLKEISGAPISLKDFRTLVASAGVLETLAQAAPASGARARRSQVLSAVREAAEQLSNTPTVCRKSYVHATVVTAFESGALERFSRMLKGCRSAQKRAEILARIVARAKLDIAEAAT